MSAKPDHKPHDRDCTRARCPPPLTHRGFYLRLRTYGTSSFADVNSFEGHSIVLSLNGVVTSYTISVRVGHKSGVRLSKCPSFSIRKKVRMHFELSPVSRGERRSRWGLPWPRNETTSETLKKWGWCMTVRRSHNLKIFKVWSMGETARSRIHLPIGHIRRRLTPHHWHHWCLEKIG